MFSNGGDNLRQARQLAFGSGTKTYRDQVNSTSSSQMYRFNLKQRSSLTVQLKGVSGGALELIDDRDNNRLASRKDIIARSHGADGNTLQTAALDRGVYYVRVATAANADSPYQLVLSNRSSRSSNLQYFLDELFGGSRSNANLPKLGSSTVSSSRWNADFLNRNNNNVSNYQSYDFTNPDKSVSRLSTRGRRGNVMARLNLDYGAQGPTSGIQADNFALQASVKMKLKEGRFYQISTTANDGVRFFFRDRDTGSVTTLNGDWRDRDVTDPAWNQTLSVADGGWYEFYVQYYDRTGNAALNVNVERVEPTAQVTSGTSLNLRRKPTTVNNTPIGSLDPGEAFTVRRSVQSSNDSRYPTWYEVVTTDNQRGYVAATNGLVQLNDGTQVGVLGEGGGTIANPTNTGNNSNNNSNNGGVPAPNNGGNSGTAPFPSGGTSGQTGGYTFSTNISRDSSAYKSHLQEILTPSYYSSSYKPIIEDAAARYDWLQPSVIAAIGSRESAWGLLLSPNGPSGTGDYGHGRGLMQIDDRFHTEFINSGKWRDPKENLTYAIDSVLAPNYSYLAQNTNLQGVELLRAALASYNAGLGNVMDALEEGRDADYYTTGRDYGRDVLNRAGWFQLNGWT